MYKTEIRKCNSCDGKGYTEKQDDKIINAFIRTECSICNGTGKYGVPINISNEWLKEKKRKDNEYKTFFPELKKKVVAIPISLEELNIIIDDRVEEKILPILDSLKMDIIKIVSGEVRSQINNDEIHRVIKGNVENYVGDTLKPIINQVVTKTSEGILRRYNTEFNIAKELCLSIDREIKHITMKAPINYETQDKVINTINKEIQQISDKYNTNKELLKLE